MRIHNLHQTHVTSHSSHTFDHILYKGHLFIMPHTFHIKKKYIHMKYQYFFFIHKISSQIQHVSHVLSQCDTRAFLIMWHTCHVHVTYSEYPHIMTHIFYLFSISHTPSPPFWSHYFMHPFTYLINFISHFKFPIPMNIHTIT